MKSLKLRIYLIISLFLVPFIILGIYAKEEGNQFQHLDSLAEAEKISTTQRKHYARTLIELADKKKLYNMKTWHNLMHYKKTVFGVKSLIDDPRFFLAENGKHDPRAEMYATIRYFLLPSESIENSVCRFMARYAWLKK